MKKKVGMYRGLSGLQLNRDDLAKAFCIFNGLVQHVVLLFLARPPGEVSMVMRARDEFHAGVSEIGLVDRQPDGCCFRGGHRPIAGVLVPGDRLAIAGHLAEEMRAPADDVRPEYVPGDSHDGWVGQDVPDGSVEQVRGADGVAVVAGRQGFFEQAVEEAADVCNLRVIIDSQVFEIPVTIELFDLLPGEGFGRLCARRVEPMRRSPEMRQRNTKHQSRIPASSQVGWMTGNRIVRGTTWIQTSKAIRQRVQRSTGYSGFES